MQIWSMDWTLKSWQVKTMCPVRWSDEEGAGAEVAFGEGELNAGVANGCVSAGDEDEEGAEA